MEHSNKSFRLVSFTVFLTHTLLFIIYIGPVMGTTTGTAVSFTNETDQQALLAIKAHIVLDPFMVLSSWNHSIHFCNWHGVTCGHRHQRVTVVNLSSLELMGSISPYVGNLTFLREIILENNSFHGPIPQEIDRLFRLQYLSLSNNSFQGEFPTNLSHCSEIRVINMQTNNLKGKIPTELGLLSKLLVLHLSRNYFTGLIPPSLGNLSTLRSLSLSENSLAGSIPLEFGKFSTLEFLQLSLNLLSGTIPFLLYNISSIQYFGVAFNRLSGTLPPDIGNALSKLQIFFVGGNQFSGTIPASITNVSRLQQFDIGLNAFIGPIPKNLGNLQNLQRLNFESNTIGINEAVDFSFLTSLANCSNLRILHLGNNNFGGVLPDSIGNLSTRLVSLTLDENRIYGPIPEGIGNLVMLYNLALYGNMLTGSIPDSIGRLARLQGLDISRNKISGKIPSSICNSSLLSILAMQGNMIEGSIPSFLGDCRNLQELDLSCNQLTGFIPLEVVTLSFLSRGLNLSQNLLNGSLPMEVGSMSNIGILDISNNKLSGTLPSTLGNCKVLEFLNLQGNFFQGTIPLSLGDLRGIQVLDLSGNYFSGTIPASFSSFPYIQYLNLSFNRLEGEVPYFLGSGNISKFSISGNKDLCGGMKPLNLPACPQKIPRKQERKRLHRKPFDSVVMIVAATIVVLFMFLAQICCVIYWTRSSKPKSTLESPLGNQYPKLSYAELLHATNCFSPANLIGEGRFSSVYRGILSNGEQAVAVKVLNLRQRGAKTSFKAECEVLRNIRHRNIVKIITACSGIDFKGDDFRALVYEFMPNGSLESWLHPSSSTLPESKSLSLIQKLNIAIDVASALDYLHHRCEIPVVHRDLKPSNILLDDELCGHVGDFGLARFLLAPTNKQTSLISVGTVGYIALEYGMGRAPWTQGDVYSFGILLLEMFTGKRPTNSMFRDDCNLHNYVKMALPDRVLQIVDPLILQQMNYVSNRTGQRSRSNSGRLVECLAYILRLGVICSAQFPRERMDIKDVLTELHVIRNFFPLA